MIAFSALRPHVKRLKPTDIVEFEWEEKERIEQVKKAMKTDYGAVFPKTLKK